MEPTTPVYQNPNPPVYRNSNVNPNPPVVDPNAPVSATDRVAQVVYLVFGVLDVLIAIRLILRLLAANPDAGFTSFIYNLTYPFVAPFIGVFPAVASRGNVLEPASVLAIVVYALVGFVIGRLIQLMGRRLTRG